MAVATFEATEAVASVVFTTVASSENNNYFNQLNYTFECHYYIAITHCRNCSLQPLKQFRQVLMPLGPTE